jgi:xylose isomerase
MRDLRYASFDTEQGKAFENGELSLEDLALIALENGAPKQISGQQERYENIINQYI